MFDMVPDTPLTLVIEWKILCLMHMPLFSWNKLSIIHSTHMMMMMMMMMTMMMMNYFCGMVDRQKTFSLISSRGHCQRSSPSRIWHAASRVWPSTEPEFRLSWMKSFSSDNHYTTEKLKRARKKSNGNF